MKNLYSRNERQNAVFGWVIECFGEAEATSLTQRAIRLLEESIETFQACEGDKEMAHKLVDYVFSRPVGELKQELGGVGVTLLALAAAADLTADYEELTEVMRIMSKSKEHFQERAKIKNEAGFHVNAKN